MSVEAVRRFLAEHGLADAYRSFETSSATVELAAAALGCEPGRIAKSLTFATRGGPVIVVVMGTARVDNRKFKDQFGEKASFAKPDELESLVGHPMGGVCPFAALPGVRVFFGRKSAPFRPGVSRRGRNQQRRGNFPGRSGTRDRGGLGGYLQNRLTSRQATPVASPAEASPLKSCGLRPRWPVA